MDRGLRRDDSEQVAIARVQAETFAIPRKPGPSLTTRNVALRIQVDAIIPKKCRTTVQCADGRFRYS